MQRLGDSATFPLSNRSRKSGPAAIDGAAANPAAASAISQRIARSLFGVGREVAEDAASNGDVRARHAQVGNVTAAKLRGMQVGHKDRVFPELRAVALETTDIPGRALAVCHA